VRGRYAHVYLDESEERPIAAHLELSLRAFRERYTVIDEYGWTELRFPDDHCVFLDPDSRLCRVHEVRPVQCRTFPFWRPMVHEGAWTEEARAICEGVGRGPAHPWSRVKRAMAEFEASGED
jgi:Fe-S-cluster containining protein